jgi:hypothetical protein
VGGNSQFEGVTQRSKKRILFGLKMDYSGTSASRAQYIGDAPIY